MFIWLWRLKSFWVRSIPKLSVTSFSSVLYLALDKFLVHHVLVSLLELLAIVGFLCLFKGTPIHFEHLFLPWDMPINSSEFIQCVHFKKKKSWLCVRLHLNSISLRISNTSIWCSLISCVPATSTIARKLCLLLSIIESSRYYSACPNSLKEKVVSESRIFGKDPAWQSFSSNRCWGNTSFPSLLLQSSLKDL